MQHLSAWVGVIGLAVMIFVQCVGLAFWLGRVSQRLQAVEKSAEANGGSVEKLAKLEVQMEHANKGLEKLGREMEGVNRQLGNIAMGRVGKVSEIGGGT